MSILWVDWLNPVPHVMLADNLTDTQITNIQEEYKARLRPAMIVLLTFDWLSHTIFLALYSS